MSEEKKEQVTEEQAEDSQVEVSEVSADAGSDEEQPKLENLAQKLEETQAKADENWDKLLRVKAEMENLKRRTEIDLQNAHKFALEKFSKEMLSVADSLELGLQSFNGDGASVEDLKKGVDLTLKQLQSVFEKFNIAQLDPAGEPFNPEFHQAMSMQPSAEHAPNTVLTVFQKGYTLNERLLRPAMVVVSQQQPGADAKKIDEQA